VESKQLDEKSEAHKPIVTVLGYPSKPTSMGGLRWLKRVVDHIEEKRIFCVRKVANDRIIASRINKDRIVAWTFFSLIDDILDALKALFTSPDIVILDTYGEANLVLWVLLRLFRRKVRILSVFHHYETTPIALETKSNNNKFSRIFCMYYNYLVEYAFKKMIKNSDRIITVSVSSKHQLYTLCGLSEDDISKKVSVVGASVDPIPISSNNKEKDIDFLCVGRINKFEGIEKIWELVIEKKLKANFVMIGKASKIEIDKLRKLGIDHRGIVPENEKFNLYQRAKVFLFPSAREGFGMAVAEALAAGLAVIAWKIPVFEELYSNYNDDNNNDDELCKFKRITLIKQWDYKSFAEEASNALNNRSNANIETVNNKVSKTKGCFDIKTWKDVGDGVMRVLEGMSING
jgi:glycosyltransferase involved in cell wall biosynthesis